MGRKGRKVPKERHPSEIRDAFWFGLHTKSRQYFIENETALVARKLFNFDQTQLAIIFEGTYIRHEKSRNNEYQRKSYFRQKKVPLCKPFTICTTNGYILDIAGPFNATVNYDTIIKILIEDLTGIKLILRPGDFCIVNRGFRDALQHLEDEGYNVLMPAFEGNRAQLTSEEANSSRFVTKVRWVVEAVQPFDNKMLPSIRSVC